MEIKWVAVIAAWFAVGGSVSACALAWGPDGKGMVAVIAIVGFVATAFMTGGMSGTPRKPPVA